MTTISSTNIEFLLSGGSNNSDPSKSTGGPPSSFPVLGSINNLFSDITSEEATSGKVDYRCFYIKNSGSSGTLYDAQVSVSAQNLGGSYVEIGVAKATDVQRVDVTGTSISGTVVFSLGGSPIAVNWGGPFGFAASLGNALTYAGATADVNYFTLGNTYSFTVSFSGVNNNRNWPTLQVQQNNLTGGDGVTVVTRKISEGRPVNSNAPSLVTDQMSPSGVTFGGGSALVGKIGPGDFVPVWVRRTTLSNTQFSENDGFTVKISGRPFLVSSSSSSSSQALTIQYSLQPQQTFYAESFSNNEIRIGAQVVMVGSSTNLPAVLWEFSSDGGATWLEVIPTPGMSATMSSVVPGTINETLVLLDVTPSMNGWKFRVTNTEGAVSVTSNVFTLQYPIVSSSSSSSIGSTCHFIECGATTPPLAYADCGMINEPGYVYYMDCNLCKCVKTPNAPGGSSSSACHFIECGAITPPFAYADCGLIPEPGYIYQMDCNLCKCVKSPA